MLFTQNQTIDELIIRELSSSLHLTLKQLIKKIRPQMKKKITLQAWYKALKRLIEQGVVLKQKKAYSLNMSWVVEILKWSHCLKDVYLEKSPKKVLSLPQKEQERIVFKFTDLLSMNTFWAHLLVYIASQKPKDQTLYAYNPHFWFYLAGAEIEKQYNRSMKEFGIKTYIIIGSNSFLDQWNARFFDKAIIKYWLSPKPLYPDQKKYINYIGDYLIEVKIKKDIAQKIENLFEKIISLADVSQLELITLFQEKSPCTITISKSAQKAKAFKRKIKRHF